MLAALTPDFFNNAREHFILFRFGRIVCPDLLDSRHVAQAREQYLSKTSDTFSVVQ